MNRSLSSRGAPPVDVIAILTALQDQIDDLTRTVEYQQTTIEQQQQVLNEHSRNLKGRPERGCGHAGISP